MGALGACLVGVGCGDQARPRDVDADKKSSKGSAKDVPSSEQSEEESAPEPSLPKEPDCDQSVKVKFEDDQGIVRPGVRVADLLAPISKPIPIYFEADPDNAFSIRPALDGVKGTVHLEYDGEPIRYEYWKQRGFGSRLCKDQVSMSVHLELSTEGGELTESFPAYIDIRFFAGRAIELSELAVEMIIEPAQLRPLGDLFEMGEAELTPGDKAGDQYYHLFVDFWGGVPKGKLSAFQEVLVEGSDAVGPDRPVVRADYFIKPRE